MANYDVSEIVKNFLNNLYGSTRQELMKEFREATVDNTQVKHLLAEIGYEAISKKLKPTDCIHLGLIYGMTLGVIAERERLVAAAKKKGLMQ